MVTPNLPALIPPKWHDVKIRRVKKTERAIVMAVPPEEFGVARYARHIRNAGYSFHTVSRRRGELINEGWHPDDIDKLQPRAGGTNNTEEQKRDTVQEGQSSVGDTGLNTANGEVDITEHYVVMDYEGDGKSALYRITTGGSPTVILRKKQRDGKYAEDIVRWDGPPPFAVGTPIYMPHRFYGQAIADKIIETQKIKTAIKRGVLDNFYERINPRVEISETHAGVNTMDDLLIHRPGGVVRTKMPGGLNYFEAPDISQSAFPLLQYEDAQREWRTGVSRQGQGTNPNALQNQVATIANQMEDASQSRVKMVARTLAETGLRDLFLLLHATIRRNGSVPQTIRLRGSWVTVDPRSWKARERMTVNVGLGDGGKMEQLARLQLIVGSQKEAIMGGLTNLADVNNLYNSAKEMVKICGYKDVSLFYKNPADPNNPQPPAKPDPKTMEIQGQLALEDKRVNLETYKVQAQNAREILQARADIASNNNKIAGEMGLKRFEAAHKARLEVIQANNDMRVKWAAAQAKIQADRQSAFMRAWQARQAHNQTIVQRRESHAQTMEQMRENGRQAAQGQGAGDTSSSPAE